MSVRIAIVEETAASLPDYACVSIAFEVRRVFDVEAAGGDACLLSERVVSPSWIKDYDAIPGNAPLDWTTQFDVANWGFLVARVADRRVGGAVVVYGCNGLEILEAREDLAVLWDIRVTPELRSSGIGTALLAAAEKWSRRKGASWLKVETQNNNVDACRFYERHGFALKSVDRYAYPDFPEEVQLFWYKDLRTR